MHAVRISSAYDQNSVFLNMILLITDLVFAASLFDKQKLTGIMHVINGISLVISTIAHINIPIV